MSVCLDYILTFLANKPIFSQSKIVRILFLRTRLKLQGSTHLKALILIRISSLFKLDFMVTLNKIKNIGIKSKIFIPSEKQPYKV